MYSLTLLMCAFPLRMISMSLQAYQHRQFQHHFFTVITDDDDDDEVDIDVDDV